jgi:hypothetical protein
VLERRLEIDSDLRILVSDVLDNIFPADLWARYGELRELAMNFGSDRCQCRVCHVLDMNYKGWERGLFRVQRQHQKHCHAVHVLGCLLNKIRPDYECRMDRNDAVMRIRFFNEPLGSLVSQDLGRLIFETVSVNWKEARRSVLRDSTLRLELPTSIWECHVEINRIGLVRVLWYVLDDGFFSKLAKC